MKKNALKKLTSWDWTTLVAAWRYYEFRMTIASSMFPGEIVQRFFSGKYDQDSCMRIAHQFAKTDHHGGEYEWSSHKYLMDCDKTPWCKFYAFCKAYCDGFSRVVMDGKDFSGKRIHEECEAFYCEYTKRWYPKDRYIASPEREYYCAPEFVKEVRK